MNLTDWQLDQLRDALRAYKAYGLTEHGRDYSWASVAEAIAEYTEVEVPSERMRQFVEGVNTKGGGRKMPVPSAQRLEAIVAFTTHEELGLLSKKEMERKHRAEVQAPVRLMLYLRHDHASGRKVEPPSAGLAGTYRTAYEAMNANVTLQLSRPSDQGVVEVAETMDVLDANTPARVSKKLRSFGWAIVSPEDMLLAFMKLEPYGQNHIYMSVASDADDDGGDTIRQLVLMRHDYVFELGADDGTPKEFLPRIGAELQNNTLAFIRADTDSTSTAK
ncbi:MAG: hypothetical protein R3E82_11575 [Pseudomonadales bacterium]